MNAETKSQLAVALHYDRTGAPRVVAKGKGAIGKTIIEVAKAHDIPIEENEVLAGLSPTSSWATKSRPSSTRPSPRSWYSCCG